MDIIEQVLFDILLYLPVMSLLRFKAVCKNWFSLIESSDFITEHLSHNRYNKEDNFIILGRESFELGWRTIRKKLALLSVSQCQECVYDIDIPQFWHPVDEKMQLIGHCDGIVCLAYSRNEIALWNPALKQLRPMPPSLFSDRLRNTDGKYCYIYVSFGIDVKSNDHKLVRILIEIARGRYNMIGNRVEVYNLGGDNSWRITHKDDDLPFIQIHTWNGISSRKSGKCFWIARRCGNIAILLSFDFSDDVFRTMLLPDGNRDPRVFPEDHDLDFLDDKVVYIVNKTNEHGRIFDIWMLDEFGVEESWNILYKVGPFDNLDLFCSRRFSKNGELLVCSKAGDITIFYKLHLYNLRTQQGKYIQNCNIEVRESGQIIHYNASLLSLKRADVVRPTE